jgi:hypothetical protein
VGFTHSGDEAPLEAKQTVNKTNTKQRKWCQTKLSNIRLPSQPSYCPPDTVILEEWFPPSSIISLHSLGLWVMQFAAKEVYAQKLVKKTRLILVQVIHRHRRITKEVILEKWKVKKENKTRSTV